MELYQDRGTMKISDIETCDLRVWKFSAVCKVVREKMKNEAVYEVEKILDKRGRGRMSEYLVKWRNYDDPKDNTWEPASNLKEAKEAINKFNKVSWSWANILIFQFITHKSYC